MKIYMAAGTKEMEPQNFQKSAVKKVEKEKSL